MTIVPLLKLLDSKCLISDLGEIVLVGDDQAFVIPKWRMLIRTPWKLKTFRLLENRSNFCFDGSFNTDKCSDFAIAFWRH